jgi:hypothetical protein
MRLYLGSYLGIINATDIFDRTRNTKCMCCSLILTI